MTTPKQIVETYVLHTVTNLVYTLRKNTSALPYDIAEQLDDSYTSLDHRTTWDHWVGSATTDELLEAADGYGVDYDLDDYRLYDIIDKLSDIYDDDSDDFISTMGLDLEEYECLEFWAVDGYLARELMQRGEKVLEDIFDFSYVWCRCESGQMIEADDVIVRIAEGR